MLSYIFCASTLHKRLILRVAQSASKQSKNVLRFDAIATLPWHPPLSSGLHIDIILLESHLLKKKYMLNLVKCLIFVSDEFLIFIFCLNCGRILTNNKNMLMKNNKLLTILVATTMLLVASCSGSDETPTPPIEGGNDGNKNVVIADALRFDGVNDTLVMFDKNDLKLKVGTDVDLGSSTLLIDDAKIEGVYDFDPALFGTPQPWVDLKIGDAVKTFKYDWAEMALEIDDAGLWLHLVVDEVDMSAEYGRAIKVSVSLPCSDGGILTGDFSLEQICHAIAGGNYMPGFYTFDKEMPMTLSGDATTLYVTPLNNGELIPDSKTGVGSWVINTCDATWVRFSRVEKDGIPVVKIDLDENNTGSARTAKVGIRSFWSDHIALGIYSSTTCVSAPNYIEIVQQSR